MFLGPRLLSKVAEGEEQDRKEDGVGGVSGRCDARLEADDGLAGYPVAIALAEIGLASVAPILKQVGSGTTRIVLPRSRAMFWPK